MALLFIAAARKVGECNVRPQFQLWRDSILSCGTALLRRWTKFNSDVPNLGIRVFLKDEKKRKDMCKHTL